MTSIVNAAPMANLEGIKDESTRQVPVTPESVAIHTPLFMGLAERGDGKTTLTNGGKAINKYGDKTFDSRSKFYDPSKPFISQANAEANGFMFKRLIPSDAKKATARLTAILSTATLPEYQRGIDGMYVLDADGLPQQVGTNTVDGYTIEWRIAPLNENDVVGSSPFLTTDNQDGTFTYEYPIYDFVAGSEGMYGDNIGFRLSVPNVYSRTLPDADLMEQEKAMVLRMEFVERADALASPRAIVNLNGQQSVDFVLKEGVIDKFNLEKYIDRAVVPAYSDMESADAVYPPIGTVHFYKENFADLVTKIKTAEEVVSPAVSQDGFELRTQDMYQINPFTLMTYEGVPYFTVQDRAQNVLFDERATHYLSGGNDGDTSIANVNAMIIEAMEFGWEDPADPLADDAKKPFSTIWDGGYEMETKRALCRALGERKDVNVILSTHVHGEQPLNWAEEESRAVMLQSYAASYPESEIHGTACCRAIVVGGSGFDASGLFKDRLPLSFDLCAKVSRFMGAGSGIMKDGAGFDESPQNQITQMRDITGTFKPVTQRQKDWSAGMVWAQGYDTRSDFYPAVQTVYNDDTSVLNSAINMFIATELEKVCSRVWRQLTGNSKLTSDQFIQRSNELIEENTTGRFDNRVVIEPETFYTAYDELRGYSWSCRINMYANNMKTVGTMTVVSRRRSDLEDS